MVECQDGAGFHSLAPDQVFHEVVDPQTGERLADGQTGMMAFTHLMRRGTLFLRYQVGDVVSLTNQTCPHCGRTSVRITSQPVRSGDIVKIKGTLVNLQVLKDRLDRFPALDEYQIVVQPVNSDDPFSMDELVIRIAPTPGEADDVGVRITEEATKLVHVRPRIETAARDDIYDPLVAAKPKRVLDRRPPRN